MGIHQLSFWDNVYQPETREVAHALGVDQLQPVDGQELKSGHLQDLLAYWERVRDGQPLPLASNLNPAQISRHLSQVFLLQVEQDPLKFKFRLVGEDPTAAFGVNAAGFEVEKIEFEGLAAGKMMHELYAWIVTQRNPLALCGPNPTLKDGYNYHEVVYLPFCNDDARITRILGAGVYYRT
ncbi:MAG: PAS domain-containing protein [Parvibaculum sp.]